MDVATTDVVPAESARSYRVDAGQRFRIVAHEGPQVCDAVFVGADDHSLTYSSDLSVLFNQLQGTGDMNQIETLYSRPPGMEPMLRVTADTIGHHFPWAGGMCSSYLYEVRDGDSDHPNCADNLLAALNEQGLGLTRVPEVFNIGMNVVVEDDEIQYRPPEFERGDYIEFEAETDLIVAISACPNDTTVMNESSPKSLEVQFEAPPE
ncbi:DUF1989 domain-containing protein [Halovenus marina]|uniref:DUF1989 domain-containing protein n=1 Tax=Halovenus marina TaxID=3396621 RepID=UPI003F550E5B